MKLSALRKWKILLFIALCRMARSYFPLVLSRDGGDKDSVLDQTE